MSGVEVRARLSASSRAPGSLAPLPNEESGFWPPRQYFGAGIEARETVFGASVVDALLGITLGITGAPM